MSTNAPLPLYYKPVLKEWNSGDGSEKEGLMARNRRLGIVVQGAGQQLAAANSQSKN